MNNSLEYINSRLERAEDMHDLDLFNFWWCEREKVKRELKEKE